MSNINEPLYPQNPCPGCDRNEPLEALPGLSELPLAPDQLTMNPNIQVRVHVPSDTPCRKFMPREMAESNPNIKVLRNARLMSKEDVATRR